MSGTDELRESILLMWHGATTNLWNSRFIMLGILTFFCMCLTQLCVRAVRRCTLDSTVVVSNVHREGGGAEIYSFTCDGRICLCLGNWTWRRPRAFTVALMVTDDEQRLNYVRNMA